MPLLQTGDDVDDVVLTTGGSGSYEIQVRTIASDFLVGTITVTTGTPAYVAGVGGGGEALYFKFIGTMDISEGDTLQVDEGGADQGTWMLPDIVAAVDMFPDTNLHLWLDSQMGQGALLVRALEETLNISEDQEQMDNFNYTKETIKISETNEHDTVFGETAETINFSEDFESDENNFGETEETITISEESFVERGITEETISIGEYNIFFTDDIYGIGKIITERFDMKSSNLKIIQYIKLKLRDTSNITVRIHFRMGSNDAWQYSNYVPINSKGEALIPIAGIEFKLEVYSAVHSTLYIEGMRVSFKELDKRSQRSPNALPA